MYPKLLEELKNQPSHTIDCNFYKSGCPWIKTHLYCPHEEHKCDCREPITPFKTSNQDVKTIKVRDGRPLNRKLTKILQNMPIDLHGGIDTYTTKAVKKTKDKIVRLLIDLKYI